MSLAKIISLFVFAVLLGLPSANASEEDFAIWKSIKIEFGSLGKAGPSTLEIDTGKSGIEKFVLFSFAKTVSLTEVDLAKIRNFPLQSIKVTHEAGYEEIGGYSVHVRLHRFNSNSSQDIATVTFQQRAAPTLSIRTVRP